MKKFSIVIILLLTTLSFAKDRKEEIKETIQNSLQPIKNSFDKTVTKVNNTGSSIIGQTSNGIGTIYGDTKNSVSTVYTDIKSLAPDAKSALQEIYSTLKTTSKYAWDLLVKQQGVWAWGYLIGELLFIFILYKFWKSLDKIGTDRSDTGGTKGINYIPAIYLGVGSIILGYLSVIHFEPMMTGFFNPEFGALRNLIELSKTIK